MSQDKPAEDRSVRGNTIRPALVEPLNPITWDKIDTTVLTSTADGLIGPGDSGTVPIVLDDDLSDEFIIRTSVYPSATGASEGDIFAGVREIVYNSQNDSSEVRVQFANNSSSQEEIIVKVWYLQVPE